MLIKVLSIDPFSGESVIKAEAETEDGQHLTFAGDYREMMNLSQQLLMNLDEDVWAEIEPWQILKG